MNQNIKKIIGDRIRSERLKRSMTAEELASFLDVSPSFVGLIERGKRGTNIKLLLGICDIFQLSIDDLLSAEKLAMCENKNDEYNSRLDAVNGLSRTLNINELDFIISTIKNLHRMKNKCDETDSSDSKPQECFY